MKYVVLDKNQICITSNVGDKFKNNNGSIIGRSKYGVGKMMGSRIYLHKKYVEDIIDKRLLLKAIKLLPDDFSYNCISYDFKQPDVIRFDEAPDFNTAREPIPGKMITVNLYDRTYKISHSNQIWHHKWTWVKNDYHGFDVEESYNWSKLWTSKINDISGIGSKRVWEKKLEEAGL